MAQNLTRNLMSAKKSTIDLQVYKDKSKEYRWRIVHKNGKVLADSGEGYARRRNCVNALRNLYQYITAEEIDTISVI